MLHSDVLSQKIALQDQSGGKNLLPIGYSDAVKLENALKDDATSLAHAALASFFEGLHGVCKNKYVWSQVKFYYSVFYACRAILMLRNVSIFYIKNSPYMLISKPGERATRKKGNTHTVVLKEFESRFSSDALLSQDIDGTPPLEWLVSMRNAASYKTAPFSDPETPMVFAKNAEKMRIHLIAYLGKDKSLYTFDPDHAMISYPIAVILKLNDDLISKECRIVDMNAHYANILTDIGCSSPNINSAFSAYKF